MTFSPTDDTTRSDASTDAGPFPISRLGYGLLGSAIFLTLWAAVGYAVFSRPGYEQFSGFLPLAALKALFHLGLDPDFWASVFASLRRVGVGVFLAFVLGVPSGLLIGFYGRIHVVTHAPLQFLRMVSPLSWMPIALLVFPRFEEAIYFLVFMATVWPIILNTVHGVSRVDPQWMLMARNQGATDFQMLAYVVTPASVPYILASLRLAVGVAWIVLVPAEFLGISSGLGYLINDARDTMTYDRLMALILAIGAIGFLLDGVIALFQRRWARGGGKPA